MPEAYAKPCQISRMIRHTENPDIVRTVHSIQFTVFKQFQVYLGTFNNIQPCSGIVRDIKACCGTFRHYWEKNSKMFPCEAFFSCIFDGMLSWSVLDPRNPPWSEVFGLCVCAQSYSFGKTLHLKCLTVFWVLLSW